jgi:predicted type IV restriction endonuclease
MTTSNELRAGLLTLARRSVSIMTACSNEESTKLYLVLPFLGLLGYDYANPYEVYPEHVAQPGCKTDFAILRDGLPVIAIDVEKSGSDLNIGHDALARYFAAVPEAKLAIQTNGTLFQFFVDSAAPNTLDAEPYLTVDLETIARAGVTDEVLEALIAATKDHYDPETVAEAAHVQLVKRRLRTVFVSEASGPSEEFCRYALERIGLKSVAKPVIERYYAPMIKSAFEESLVAPVVERLKSQATGDGRSGTPVAIHQLGQRIATTEHQLQIFNYVRRRLAYLAEDDAQFEAIESVRFTDYVGRISVFYERERKGRLFDYIEGADGYDKYIFPDPIGEIISNNVLEIDTALKTVFTARVKELGGLSNHQRLSRSA